jgi:hypothetical protein
MKQLLRENFSRDWKEPLVFEKLPLQEGTLIESNGNKYSPLASYTVKLWNLGVKNLNERIYTEKLGEKVCRDFGNLVTMSLADHPKEEGSVKDIVAVCKHPHIKEKVMWIDIHIVDEAFAKKLNNIIEIGGAVGISSSCYGDLSNDGEVLEEGFEVDRFADIVLTPSAQVYITKETRQVEKENIPTNIMNESNFIDSSIEKKKDSQKENSTMADKLTTLEEKNLKLGIKTLFEKAEAKADLKEKLIAYNEILEYCEGVEFAKPYVDSANIEIAKIAEATHALAEKGKLLEGVEKEKVSLEEKAKETGKAVEDATGTLSKVSENFEKAVTMLNSFKSREKKLKEMYEIAVAERNGMIEASEYKELAEKYDELEEKVEKALDENSKFNKMLKKYKNRILQLEAEADEEEEEEENDKDEVEAKAEETFRRNRQRSRREGGGLANLGDKKAEPFDAEDAAEARGEKEDKPAKKDADKEDKKEGRTRRQYDNGSIREEDDGDYDFTEAEEIKEYVQDLLEQNPANKKIKNQLLKCKTLFEAQKTYLDLMDLVEDTPSPYRTRMNENSNTYGGVQVSNQPASVNRMLRKGWR